MGRIANLLGQMGPGKPKTKGDSGENREKWFAAGLEDLGNKATARGIHVVAMPFLIGCGLGGGDWPAYLLMIQTFAAKFQIDVVLYKKDLETERGGSLALQKERKKKS